MTRDYPSFLDPEACIIISINPAVSNLFGTRDQFCGRQFFHGRDGGGGDGSGGNESDGERWGAADEASLTHLPLTSCSAAQFLTGHGPVPGVGDPCINPFSFKIGQLSKLSWKAAFTCKN